jgi:hypothetical protein
LLLTRNLRVFQSIEATLNLSIVADEPAFATRLQAGLLAVKPSGLRLKAYAGPASVLDMATDGDSVWAYFPRNSLFVLGTLEEAINAASSNVLVNVLLAVGLHEALLPSPFDAGSCETRRLDRKTCSVEEDFESPWSSRARVPESGAAGVRAPVVRRVARFDSRRGLLIEVRFVDPEGHEQMTVTYGDYRKAVKGLFPHDVAVVFPQEGVRMRLAFDRVGAGPDVEEPSAGLEPLRVRPPEHVVIQEINALGR